MTALGEHNSRQEAEIAALKAERLALLEQVDVQQRQLEAMSDAIVQSAQYASDQKAKHDALHDAVMLMSPCLVNPNDIQAMATYLAAIERYKALP